MGKEIRMDEGLQKDFMKLEVEDKSGVLTEVRLYVQGIEDRLEYANSLLPDDAACDGCTI